VIHPLAGLLVPELWWDARAGFGHLEALIEDALEIGVGGFVVRNGPRDAVQALTDALRRDAPHPLLLAAEVEAGVGGTFATGTALPPLGALGALRDAEAFRRAAKLTARELGALGLNWALAPVAELAGPPANPVLGARAAGDDAQRVAEWLVDWVDACQAEGILACARGFPGAGRASLDPWADAAVAGAFVAEDAATLWATDLVPYRGLTDAGVASVAVSPVAFPGLDRSGVPACHSSALVTTFLRGELRYDGLIVAEAAGATAARRGGGEGDSVVAAVRAGCDLVLAPHDLHEVLTALEDANDAGALDLDALETSRARRRFWADWAAPRAMREPTLDDVLWARQVADLLVHPVRGVVPALDASPEVVVLDDAVRGPWAPPAGAPLLEALRAVGFTPRPVDTPTSEGRGPVLLALFGGPAAARGRVSWCDETLANVRALHEATRARHRSLVVLVFAPPALAAAVPDAPHVVCAWGDARAMQEGAARRLA
jgi:beta-glucosidase-like glycosyl hydrolase